MFGVQISERGSMKEKGGRKAINLIQLKIHFKRKEKQFICQF